MLAIRNLSKTYVNGIQALQDVSLEILRGEYEEGSTIRVDWNDQDFVFTRADTSATESVVEPAAT